MKGKIWKAVPLFVFATLILTGCATRIRFAAERPPNLDTIGIRRIAIMPFTTAAGGATGQIAQDLTGEVTSRILATGAFELADPNRIRDLQARGQSIEDLADALFRGRVIHHDARTTSGQMEHRYRAADGSTGVRSVTVLTREVDLTFEYYFVRTRDATIVGPVIRTGRSAATCGGTGNLPADRELVMNIIRSQLQLFYRDVAPHSIVLTRTMARESDSALRPLMNAADARRRAGDYRGAREAYVAIWNDHRSIAAAINAAILYEATGALEDGIFFMEQVFGATRAPQVSQKLAALNREVAYIRGFEAFDGVQAPAERVAGHAVDEIRRYLPAVPRVWIHTHTAASLPLVNHVIDNMTSTFLRDGVTIVDRQAINLILAEQNLHLDGAVADSDFLRIGNLAGANTIVIVDIIGSGAVRRLSVRVLEMDTGTVRMQSDTGDVWRL